MKKIMMIESESVATSVGAKQFVKGQQYTVEDWVANSLMGRGLATLVKEPTLKELRAIAKEKGVVGYNKLSKGELLAAIESTEPPKEPFEPLPLKGKR